MKIHYILFICGIVISGLLVAGCGSSEETHKDDQAAMPPQSKETPPAPPAGGNVQPPVAEKIDTFSVNKQNTERPIYDSKTTQPSMMSMPTGKFSVQVGAYKMPDNADKIVALAKERFARSVYLYQDKVDNLYKVMIGDFISKDEARRFRDEMAQKYPTDYKDAWVSENSKK